MFNMSVSSSDGWFLDTFDRTMEMVHCSRISQVIRLDLKPLPIGFPWRLSFQFNTSISPNKSYESKSTIIRTPSYQDSKHQKGLNKTWRNSFRRVLNCWIPTGFRCLGKSQRSSWLQRQKVVGGLLSVGVAQTWGTKQTHNTYMITHILYVVGLGHPPLWLPVP